MESHETNSLDGEVRPSVFQGCALCPLHCSKNIPSLHGLMRLELPKQTGLYGQIGHLKAQIESLKKLHQKEKDVLVQQIQGLETKYSAELDKTAQLSSKNLWLENRMEFLSDIIGKGSQGTSSKQRNGYDVDSNLRQTKKRTSSPLRRSKSQDLTATSTCSSRLRLPISWSSSSKNLYNTRPQDDTTKLRSGNLQTTYKGSFDGITNSLASNCQMAPIQEIDEDVDWVKEKDQFVLRNKRLEFQVRQLEKQRRGLESNLQEARDQLELSEFRILELEGAAVTTIASAAKEIDEDSSSKLMDAVTAAEEVDLFSLQQLDILRSEDWDICWPTFREEKFKEIQSKVLDIVRNRSSVNVVDKTTLVQAVALLDVCNKLILESESKPIGGDEIGRLNLVSEIQSLKCRLQGLERDNENLVRGIPLFTSQVYGQRSSAGDHLLDSKVESSPTDVSTSESEVDVLQLVEKMERLRIDIPPMDSVLVVSIPTTNSLSNDRDICDKCHVKCSIMQSQCFHCALASEVDVNYTEIANGEANRRVLSNSLATELKELNSSLETNSLVSSRCLVEGTWAENRNEIYDKLMEALSAKQLEMKNKETEYALKLDALKYDREEVVSILENRLISVQQRELQCRKELDAMAAEKVRWRERSENEAKKVQELELERDGLTQQLTAVQKDFERTCRDVEDLKSQNDYNTLSGFASNMDSELMQAKVDELKRHESRHRQRIQHLESRWDALRSQLMIASSESGSGGVCCDDDDEVRSSDDEAEELLARVSEALSTQLKLRQRVAQMEKKEAAYRETLDEADRIVAEVEHNYQERMDAMQRSEQRLRQRITQLEQSESHLRQALNCNSTKRDEVSKVGELMERIMETEAVEARLRERLVESERREEELKVRLVDTELARRQAITLESQEQEEEFLRNLENLKRTEHNRQRRIEELEASESALKETLRNADDILATREHGFQETIACLKAQLATNCTDILTKMNMFSWEEVDKMSAELQSLSGWEVGFHSLKEQLKDISRSISACSRCQTNVGPALGHLETQMRHLHEIVFGSQTTSLDFQLMAGNSNRSTEGCCVRRGVPGPNSFEQRSGNYNEIMRNTNDQKRNLVETCLPTTDASIGFTETNDNYQVERNPDNSQNEEIINELQSKVDWLETQLSKREQEMWTVDQEVSMQQARLQQRDREYEDKCSEMSLLAQQTSRLHEENEELRRKLWKTEVAHKVSFDKASKKISDLEAKAATLVKQLKLLESVQKDYDSMQEMLNNAENELKKKRETEHRLCAENLHLHHKVEGLRERVSSLQLLKRDHKSLLTKHSTLEKKLAASELALGPLNNQISGLRRDCWDKERVIGRLSAAIRKTQMVSPDNASFLLDHRKLVSQSSSQSSDDSGIKDCSGVSSNGRESEMSEDSVLTDISSPSLDLARTLRASSPVGSSASSSLSSEANDCSVSPQPDSRNHTCDDATATTITSPSSTTKSRIPRYTALKSPACCDTGSLKGSISRTSSQSSLQSFGGRSTRSDSRRATSKTSCNGYNRRSRYNSTSSSDGSSCTDKTGNESELKIVLKTVSSDTNYYTKSKGSTKVKVNHLSTSVQPKTTATLPKGIPDAPRNFHVTRKVGQDGLLVAWNIPSMDPSGCSNGVTVSGYQILVNNQLHQKVRSAHRTKALLNNLDFNAMLPMEISIQTSSITGQQSAAVSTCYSGIEDLPPPKVPLSKFVWTEGGTCNGVPINRVSKSRDANCTPTVASYSPLSRLVEV